MADISREYVTLSTGRQVHYRKSGSGPPIVLLHPSPQCSEVVIPALEAFSPYGTCFGIDTPGYGLSDPLANDTPGLNDYATAYIDAIDQLGIDRFCLYGTATGAQMAIELAKRHPDRVALLMLDSSGHVSGEEHKRILDGYMPDVTPRRDGGHMLTYWDMCRHLYIAFPWASSRLEDRLPLDLPPASVLHATLIRYLRAGAGYSKAYKVAFDVENFDHLKDVKVPTTLMRWEGSIVLGTTDDMIAHGLPSNMQVLHGGPSIAERYDAQIDAIQRLYQDGSFKAPPPVKRPPSAPKLERAFVQTGDSLVHLQRCTDGGERPTVILHGAGEANRQVEALATSLVGKHPAYLIDLPHHGESAATGQDISLESLAEPIAGAIEHLRLSDIHLIGRGLGGAVALHLANRVGASNVTVTQAQRLSLEARTEFSEKGLDDLTPQVDGTHLIRAWTILRDGEYYAPWYDHRQTAQRDCDANLKPEILHNRTVDLLKVAGQFDKIKALEINTDWDAAVRATKVPVTFNDNQIQ